MARQTHRADGGREHVHQGGGRTVLSFSDFQRGQVVPRGAEVENPSRCTPATSS